MADERARRGNAVVGPQPRHRKKYSGKKALAAFSIIFMLVVSFWFYQDNSWRFSAPSTAGNPKVALLDQLSATLPDQSFIDTIRTELSSAGYSFDYYGPADVNVALFRDLPSKGYNLVIVRSHSAPGEIFTAEPYSASSHVWEQITDQVGRGVIDGQSYFTITYQFVRQSMRGSFPDSLILVMGCSSLYETNIAQAFLNRGAAAYVGWDGSVNVVQTDKSAETLLGHLADGKTVRDSVSLTTAQLGSDPVYGGHLSYFDSKVALEQQVAQRLPALSVLFVLLALTLGGPLAVLLIPRFLSRR